MNEPDPKREGWIRFGVSALGLAEREQEALSIHPRVGHCVFFPGYVWHGTVPFESIQTRLTVPCDIDPAG
jgi:hypothetical protein